VEIHWLDLPDLLNARDVGGLPLTGGGTTRAGVLMRCETPDLLTAEGIRRISGVYGVRHVFDLRSRNEGLPVEPWEGVERHHLPLLGRMKTLAANSAEAAVQAREDAEVAARGGVGDVAAGQIEGLDDSLDLNNVDEHGAGRLYLAMAERGRDAFVTALGILTGPDSGPALVHCTAGKDRTGVLVAMLLQVAGVTREAIVADYAVTAINIKEMFRRIDSIRNQPRLKPGSPASKALRGAAPVTMEAFLDELAGKYGSAAGFLLEAGATERQLDDWRKMITP
jgi:protein tyrosine/serine phosphatase